MSFYFHDPEILFIRFRRVNKEYISLKILKTPSRKGGEPVINNLGYILVLSVHSFIETVAAPYSVSTKHSSY